MLKKNCIVCNKNFYRKKDQAYHVWEKRKYCSSQCYWNNMKGKDYSSHLGKFAKKGAPLPKRSFKSMPHSFKGTVSEYKALHCKIGKLLGKPNRCQSCYKIFFGRDIEWANKSGKYLEDLNDWIRLCKKCHWVYDKQFLRMYL